MISRAATFLWPSFRSSTGFSFRLFQPFESCCLFFLLCLVSCLREKQGVKCNLALGLILAALVCSARADRVDDYLAAQMEQHQIPGVALSIIRDGKTIKVKGYGMANLEWRVP